MVTLAFYGDDFTGSVDALLQLRRTGLDGVLATSVEAAAAASACDVVGIAGISRSLPTDELAAEVTPALAALLALQPQVLQYKVCSTADSSPNIGSIGRVIEIGRDLTGATAATPALFAQPDFGRFTVFSHHFAADGALVYRLDRQPTMANHPVTPATESDLRLHLAAQTTLTIKGDHEPDGACDVVVVDALTDDQLQRCGERLLRAPGTTFAVGSGGLSRGVGLAAAAGHTTTAPLPTTAAPAAGRTLVLSGSASPLTWQQVQAASAAGFTALALSEPDVLNRALTALAGGEDVVVYSFAPDQPTGSAIAERLAQIGRAALAEHSLRLVVCGGDTCGAVLRELGATTLRITAAPWGNVALCQADGVTEGGTDIALKGGQMGHLTLFDDIRTGTPLI